MRIPIPSEMRSLALRFTVRVVASFAQAIFLLVVARLLGPSDFGLFAIALACFAVVGVITGFGASTRMLRIAAEGAPGQVTFSLAVLRLASVGLIVSLGLVVSMVLSFPDYMLIALFLSASDQLFDFAVSTWSGRQSHIRASICLLIQRILPLIFLLLLMWSSAKQVGLVLVPNLAIAIVMCLILALESRVHRFELGIIRSSVPYWGATLATNLSQLESIALSAVATPSAIANYAVGSRLAQPLTIFVSVLQVIFIPRLASSIGQPQFDLTIKRLRAVAASYAVLLAVFSPVIVMTVSNFLGNEFGGSSLVLYAFVFGAALSSYSQTYQMTHLAAGNPKASTRVIAVGTVAGTILLLATLSVLGDQFIWLAPVYTQTLILLGLVLFSRRSPCARG